MTKILFIADLKCSTVHDILSKCYLCIQTIDRSKNGLVIYIREYILSSNIFMLPICALNFLQTSRQCQGCCTLYHVTRKTGANNNILHGLDFTFLGDLWRSRNLYQICLDISIYWGRHFTKDFDIFKVHSDFKWIHLFFILQFMRII